MIVIHPRSDHECVTADLQDYTSRVKVHIHREVGGHAPILRQLQVLSPQGAVIEIDLILGADRMECDI